MGVSLAVTDSVRQTDPWRWLCNCKHMVYQAFVFWVVGTMDFLNLQSSFLRASTRGRLKLYIH